MAQQPNPARERVRGIVPKMIEISEQVIYGDIWERPGLSKRDRSLIVVATLIATYRPEQLKGSSRQGARQRRHERRNR